MKTAAFRVAATVLVLLTSSCGGDQEPTTAEKLAVEEQENTKSARSSSTAERDKALFLEEPASTAPPKYRKARTLHTFGRKDNDHGGVVAVKETTKGKRLGGEPLWEKACGHAIDLMKRSDAMKDAPKDQLDKILAGAQMDCLEEFKKIDGKSANETARCMLKIDRFDPKRFAECEPTKKRAEKKEEKRAEKKEEKRAEKKEEKK